MGAAGSVPPAAPPAKQEWGRGRSGAPPLTSVVLPASALEDTSGLVLSSDSSIAACGTSFAGLLCLDDRLLFVGDERVRECGEGSSSAERLTTHARKLLREAAARPSATTAGVRCWFSRAWEVSVTLPPRPSDAKFGIDFISGKPPTDDSISDVKPSVTYVYSLTPGGLAVSTQRIWVGARVESIEKVPPFGANEAARVLKEGSVPEGKLCRMVLSHHPGGMAALRGHKVPTLVPPPWPGDEIHDVQGRAGGPGGGSSSDGPELAASTAAVSNGGGTAGGGERLAVGDGRV